MCDWLAGRLGMQPCSPPLADVLDQHVSPTWTSASHSLHCSLTADLVQIKCSFHPKTAQASSQQLHSGLTIQPCQPPGHGMKVSMIKSCLGYSQLLKSLSAANVHEGFLWGQGKQSSSSTPPDPKDHPQHPRMWQGSAPMNIPGMG